MRSLFHIKGLPHTLPRAWHALIAHASVQRRVALLLSALLACSLLSISFAPVHQSLAAAQSFTTCRTVPLEQKPHACDGADPYLGSCTFDAATGSRPTTIAAQDIFWRGIFVGRAQVRFFALCTTSWARAISVRPVSKLTVHVLALDPGDAATTQVAGRLVYSNMVYGCIPTITASIQVNAQEDATVTLSGRHVSPRQAQPPTVTPCGVGGPSSEHRP